MFTYIAGVAVIDQYGLNKVVVLTDRDEVVGTYQNGFTLVVMFINLGGVVATRHILIWLHQGGDPYQP